MQPPIRMSPSSRGTGVNWLRRLGFVVLVLALPLALFAMAMPPNEYKAQGIDAVDCDGPISVYLFAISGLCSSTARARCFMDAATGDRLNLSRFGGLRRALPADRGEHRPGEHGASEPGRVTILLRASNANAEAIEPGVS